MPDIFSDHLFCHIRLQTYLTAFPVPNFGLPATWVTMLLAGELAIHLTIFTVVSMVHALFMMGEFNYSYWDGDSHPAALIGSSNALT